MTDFLGFDPAELPLLQTYALLTGSVGPRPIAFVSTLSAAGVANLAPFSYFMAGGSNPPSVVISPGVDRQGQPKDTLRNIAETGDYVINIVTYAIREPMNATSADFPSGVSEWEASGLTPVPGVKVRPARVLESPIALECRLHQIAPHGTGSGAANYVIGEVVYFHVAESVWNEGRIDPRYVDAIARLGGDWYARAAPEVLFEMPRPPRVERYP